MNEEIKQNKEIRQASGGDQSPNIVAEGDASVSYDNRKTIIKKTSVPVVAMVVGFAVIAIVSVTIIATRAIDRDEYDDLPPEAQRTFPEAAVDPANVDDAKKKFFDRYTRIQTLLSHSGDKQIEAAAKSWSAGNVNGVERQLEQQLGEPGAPVAELEFLIGHIKLMKLEYGPAHEFLALAVEHDPGNSQYLAELGSMESLLGNTQAALGHHQEALSIRREALAEDPTNLQLSKDVADSLEDVAWEYYQQFKYPESQEAYVESLAIRREILESDTNDKSTRRDIAACLNNQAILFEAMGKPLEAMEKYSEAKLMTWEALGTKEHRDYSNVLNNMGALFVDSAKDAQGNVDEEKVRKGIEKYSESLAIQRILASRMKRDPISERHPDVAASLNNLGNAYLLLGDTARAMINYKDSRDMYREFLGDNHDLTKLVARQYKRVCNCDD